jgi:hypothetical protein
MTKMAFAQTIPGASPAECEAGVIAAGGSEVQRRYIETPTGYMMVLQMGDNVFEQLNIFVASEAILAASPTATGFGHATFGFWTLPKKPLIRRRSTMSRWGALLDRQPERKASHPSTRTAWQAKNSSAFGAHLLDLEVGTGSTEITLLIHAKAVATRYRHAYGR